MFQGLRQNSLFYILDKSNLKLSIGEVVNVSNPTPKYGQGSFPAQPFAPHENFVDVKVKVGEIVNEYKQLQGTASVANSGNLIVSDSKEAMSAEVDVMLRSSRSVLDSVPYHKKVIETCDLMLRELNPQFAKEKEQEQKIDALEQRMGNIDDKLNKMFDLLSDTMGHNKTKKSNKEE